VTNTPWWIDAWLGWTRASRIAKAFLRPDDAPVLLKVAQAGADASLRREYQLMRDMRPIGVAPPRALIEGPEGLAIVLGPPGPVPLVKALDRHPMDWRQVIRLAMTAANGLQALHTSDLTHRDLRPGNLLIDEYADQLLIADFSCAAPPGLAAEPTHATAWAVDADCDTVGDPWAYMSPEQTGRTERQVDGRSDLYVLGVLMYRLLCGRLPFDAGDAMEWAHCHLARAPLPMRSYAAFPTVVESIVGKLLAKAPEDRYQSCAGLQFDLERCLRDVDRSEDVPAFPLGARDQAGRLELPQQLFGRNAEAAALTETLEAVAAGGRSRLVLLSGAPGVGKTSLAQSLRDRVAALGGRCIEGKYDQEQLDVPYSALMRALDAHARQLLTDSENEVATWRRRFEDALASNTGLAGRLVPGLAHLLGPGEPPPPLDAPEAQRRLHLVLRQILGVFARANPPLVLLLDDFHAADPGSPPLLDEVLAHALPSPILVIATCRAVDGDLPRFVSTFLDHLRSEQVPVRHLGLGPWELSNVAAVLSAALRRPAAEVQRLAELILRKTGGNPFFAIEFVRELQAERLLWFDPAVSHWRWDEDAVAAKGYADNVVDLMIRRLQRLPIDTVRLLQQAACLGSAVSTPLVAALSGLALPRMSEVLAPAVAASLVQPLLDGHVAFTHDRVREAAYQLIPEHERAAMHLEAGRLMLDRLAPSEQDDMLFDIVQQVRHGAVLLQGEEAARAWSLCVRAGRKAKSASAFASARSHFRHAQQLQPADAWSSAHQQAFDLALELAECESVAGDPDDGERVLDTALARARSDAERVRVYRCRVRLRMSCSRYPQALDCAIEALGLLGIALPQNDTSLNDMLRQDRSALELALAGRRPAELLDLPPANDASPRTAIELLADAFFPARNSRPGLFPLLVVKAVMLSLQHGNTVQSCQAYALYPRLLRGEGRLDEAYGFSLLSLQLAERLQATGLRGSLLFAHLAGSYFLRQPYASGLALLQEGFDASLQAGTLYDAAGCALVAAEYLLECSDSLDEIVKAAQAYAPSLRNAHAGLWPWMLRSWIQFVRALQGRTQAPDSFDGDDFSEADYELALERSHAVALRAIHLVLKQVAASVAGRHERSLALADEAARLLRPLMGMAIEVTHRHYRALSAAALLPSGACDDDRVVVLEQELAALRALAQACPANFEHRALLIDAELARVRGHAHEAGSLYARAIDTAHRHGFVAHEAQAFERAAAFRLEQGQERVALTLLKEARDGYRQWGALVKVQALEAAHPELAAGADRPELSFDALAVAKASQALSGQIELEALIDALMRIALEHAGAQTALLYLVDTGPLQLAACATVEGAGVSVRIGPEAIEDGEMQPLAVVNYVRRTRERILLADAARPHPFLSDPYLQRLRPRSVMALPLLRRGDVVGVLYLEHRLSPHTFTWGRVALLEMLASQAAISLETARLYAALKAENAERRRAQQTALERQSRLQRLVESSLVGVPFAHLDGRIFEANDAFLEIIGCTRAELASGSLHWQALTPPEYRDADAQALEQLRHHGRYAPYEKECLRKDGTRLPVLVSGILFEGQGEQPQTVAFVLDLSARQRAASEREARIAAEAASQAKSGFLASMSHELRTPLNGILGYAQLLQMEPGMAPKQQRGLATIESSGRHLLALINDILDLARIEAGRLELAPDAVNLRRVIDVVADTVRMVAQRKRIGFDVEFDGDLALTAQADERRLSQVLLNLLGNAAKFTDRGSVTLRVHRKDLQGQGVQDQRVRVTFEVADTGVGMSAEELQRIFRPFEQVGAADRRSEGTGLGLAITDALVRQMGGTLSVRSQPGQGSVFSLELVLPVLQQAPAATPAGKVTGYEGPRRSVLIADDVSESREFMVDLLQSLGFQTSEVSDGLQAVIQANARRPDLVLMDNGMPTMTGVDAIGVLRDVPELARMPIISVSAGASEAERRHCLAAGATSFVPKPVDVQELLQAIGRALQLTWTVHVDSLPTGSGGPRT
jgi:PAS domain S-box-containing protein